MIEKGGKWPDHAEQAMYSYTSPGTVQHTTAHFTLKNNENQYHPLSFREIIGRNADGKLVCLLNDPEPKG